MTGNPNEVWEWQEMEVHMKENAAPHLAFHPACKVRLLDWNKFFSWKGGGKCIVSKAVKYDQKGVNYKLWNVCHLYCANWYNVLVCSHELFYAIAILYKKLVTDNQYYFFQSNAWKFSLVS